MADKPTRVLFICTGNVCRSQLAEALLREIGGDRFDVHSGGAIPSGVHPLAIRALDEIGIDAGGQWSKHWNMFLEAPPFDYVITLCDYAAQGCPVFPGEGRRIHWSVDDPVAVIGTEDQRMEFFRCARDQIGMRIRRFLEALDNEQAPCGKRNPTEVPGE